MQNLYRLTLRNAKTGLEFYYIGTTIKPVQIRVKQHQNGEKSWFLKALKKISGCKIIDYTCLNKYKEEEALIREYEEVKKLRQKGYKAVGAYLTCSEEDVYRRGINNILNNGEIENMFQHMLNSNINYITKLPIEKYLEIFSQNTREKHWKFILRVYCHMNNFCHRCFQPGHFCDVCESNWLKIIERDGSINYKNAQMVSIPKRKQNSKTVIINTSTSKINKKISFADMLKQKK